MKKILILFLSILVISCSSSGTSANGVGEGIGGGNEDNDEVIPSDTLNFMFNDTKANTDKAGFTRFNIKDGYIEGGSSALVYFTAPTAKTEISQLEIMRALDDAFTTELEKEASLRDKFRSNAVSVVVVEIDDDKKTATLVVRLYAADGYKFSSSLSGARSRTRSRGMDPTVKDIIIKVAVDSKNKSARAGLTASIGLVAVTEFDYYLAPTDTTAGVEYAKVNLADTTSPINLTIIPPIGSKDVGRLVAENAIKSFILSATTHGTSLKTDGTVVDNATFKLTVTPASRVNENTDTSKHSVSFTLSKHGNYVLPITSVKTDSNPIEGSIFVVTIPNDHINIKNDGDKKSISSSDTEAGLAAGKFEIKKGKANTVVELSSYDAATVIAKAQVDSTIRILVERYNEDFNNAATGKGSDIESITYDNNGKINTDPTKYTASITLTSKKEFLFENNKNTIAIPITFTATVGDTDVNARKTGDAATFVNIANLIFDHDIDFQNSQLVSATTERAGMVANELIVKDGVITTPIDVTPITSGSTKPEHVEALLIEASKNALRIEGIGGVQAEVKKTKTTDLTATITLIPKAGYEFATGGNKVLTVALTLSSPDFISPVNESDLIAELNTTVKKLQGETISGNAKFGTASMTQAEGFKATITSETPNTKLTKTEITDNVRRLLAAQNAPTGIKEEYVELKKPTVSSDGKTFTAEVAFNIADGYYKGASATRTAGSFWGPYKVTYTADDNVTFTK